VRAGSIIPFGADIQFTDDKVGAPIELWVYPGQDGEFTLYEDEGDNYNYEQGSFATIHLAWKDSERRLILDDRQGSYPGMPSTRVFRVVIAGNGPFDTLVAQSKSATTILYEGQRLVVEL
jgi:alpha-D-xyloside xylohydrolase